MDVQGHQRPHAGIRDQERGRFPVRPRGRSVGGDGHDHRRHPGDPRALAHQEPSVLPCLRRGQAAVARDGRLQSDALEVRAARPRELRHSLARHYGFPAGSPEIEFFTEHAEADLEHSRRQATLCAKYLDSDAAKARALEVAEQACLLRWASITDLYRREYQGEKEILPSGVD